MRSFQVARACPRKTLSPARSPRVFPLSRAANGSPDCARDCGERQCPRPVVGLIAGPGPAMLSEMFPTTVRYTGLGLAYSLSNAVFSGSAGLIITALIKSTRTSTSPPTT